MSTQFALFGVDDRKLGLDDWTFNGAPTRQMTHCYHDYPARMIPQVAGKLLDLFGRKASLVFDPYCGTATSLVEGMLRGIGGVGTDLNPLARLIAEAKTTPIESSRVKKEIRRFKDAVLETTTPPAASPRHIQGIPNLSFWFKPKVVQALSRIAEFIKTIEDPAVMLFFQVAFSETIRESSNSRVGEFKIFRYPKDKLAAHSPNALLIMLSKLERNIRGLEGFMDGLARLDKRPRVVVHDFNTVHDVPEAILPSDSVDIVVTSPPYGDSHTTVAYGQFSRFSSAWLGLPEPQSVDRRLMGGTIKKAVERFMCAPLDEAVAKIAAVDEKRAREVCAFYVDLRDSIRNVASVIKRRGHACYVVGNRTVKGVKLPTDRAVRSFFEQHGFSHVETFKRSIPNKRMPEKNSPSNVPGEVVGTMLNEYIVVMMKQ